MPKTNKTFVCNNCGNESLRWLGKCPECGGWSTFQEFTVVSDSKPGGSRKEEAKPQKLGKISDSPLKRISTNISEFDRVLGGSAEQNSMGIVPGSVILISGDPGIGKSTLMLQLAINLAERTSQIARRNKEKTTNNKRKSISVLYVSGEESEAQIAHRAQRIMSKKLLSESTIDIVSSTDIDASLEAAFRIKADLIIIDSVQTIGSAEINSFPGSLPQIRYVAMRVSNFAKKHNVPIFMVGHVTKEGIVAGPQLLSHMVDVVLYLEGETPPAGGTGTRLIRSFKNRYGDTQEVGIFVMDEKGLMEITAVENLFIDTTKPSIGSAITVVQEGSRPILVEIQALAIKSNLSFPRRVATGISEKRLEMLLAVLQKHGRLNTYDYDIFVNVVGGLKIKETASDLAVILSIASSIKNKPLRKAAAIGEVGLLGEVKSVLQLEKRIKEANKFGFKIVFSKNNVDNIYSMIKSV